MGGTEVKIKDVDIFIPPHGDRCSDKSSWSSKLVSDGILSS